MKFRRVIQVFVGSPGDVSVERDLVFRVIDALNDDPLLPEGWRFEGVGWDSMHYPKIAWLSPQASIDQGISGPDACDVAVFIFWKRTGTPLPPGTYTENGAGPDPTGSLWELHQALEAEPRPWVLVYRCERKPEMSDADLADPMAFAIQLKGVQDLFATFQDAQGRYVADHATYATPDDLEGRLAQDLKAYVVRQSTAPGERGETGARPAADTPRVPPAYLSRVRAHVARMELLGLDLKESVTRGLPQVYVPAVTTPAERLAERESMRPETRRALVLHRLGERSLYLPGDPGSGKSTFCRWVMYLVAEGKVPESPTTEPEDLRERLPASLAGRLPVLVQLRDFWSRMGCGPGQAEWTGRELERAIRRWVETTAPHGLTVDALERNLREGNLLLLLDGVDEVPEEDVGSDGRTAHPRHALLTGLASALPDWVAAGHRVLVTSRHYGLRAAQRDALRLPEVGLLPLDDDLQRLFVTRWYAAADPARREEYAAGLLAELEGRPELRELRGNPLLLTALCVKYKEGKRLPHDVHNLFDAVVNQVLYNRFRASDAERTRVRWRLEAVALGMHHGLDDAAPRPAPLASVDYDELDRILAHYAGTNPSTEGGAAHVLARRDELLERTGLLLPRGDRSAEFYHQDFRDFLAAEGWARDERRSLRGALDRFAGSRGWRRMLGFLFARSVEASGGVDRPLEALAALEGRLHANTLAGAVAPALLLADCLEIAAGKAGEHGLEARWPALLRRVCRDSLAVVPAAADRNALFLALGRLGWDDRPGVGLTADGLPDIEWLPVPGASGPAFFVARYPVTTAQFQTFVQAEGGYDDPRWWAGFEEHKREPRVAVWPEPNAPCTVVDWFEAIAFARWLTHEGLAAAPGWAVSLPTDAEWRLAYVGDSTADFPWAGQPDPERHANFHATELGRTTATGLFPGGAAVCGALDMAGNVYEWCLDKYDAPEPLVIDSSEDVRVLRGGAWLGNPDYLRSAFRLGLHPVSRGGSVGFRVVCRPPSSSVDR